MKSDDDDGLLLVWGNACGAANIQSARLGENTLGQGQLQRLHRPWEESAFHQRPLGPTPRQRRRSLDGIKDHAADVRFGPVLSYI